MGKTRIKFQTFDGRVVYTVLCTMEFQTSVFSGLCSSCARMQLHLEEYVTWILPSNILVYIWENPKIKVVRYAFVNLLELKFFL